MNKKIILISLLMSWVMLSHSQTVNIMDQQSKEPLQGVVLISTNPQISTITNSKGQADLSIFKEAKNIQIRSLGYQKQVKSYEDIQREDYCIRLQTSVLNLDQVVVSATRWNQAYNNIPSKITSVASKEVIMQNPQTAADLLSLSGKVYVQKSQQGGGSPMIRGFATNRLIYTIDGVRMNTAIYRAGNIQNVINIDPFAIESTEVLFGPGSVIYGSDAIGGVMSFRSLSPQLSLTESPLITGKINTRYSSANKEKTGHFDVNIGWKKWALLTSFSSWDFDHLRQGSHGPDDYIKDYYVRRSDNTDEIVRQDDPLLQIPSAYSQINLMQKLRFKPNENWDFQYAYHFSETSPYGRYDRHNRIKKGTARYAEWNYGPQSWLMNNLSVHHRQHNALYDQMNLRLAQQNFEESRISRNLNSYSRKRQVEKVDAWSANLDFTKNLGQRNTLYYGVEYVYNDVKSHGTTEQLPTNMTETISISNGEDRYPQSTWKSLAAYVNNEFRVSDLLSLQAGLRYNKFILDADFRDNHVYFPFPFEKAEVNNDALTGSIGAVVKPSESWIIKANFGTAFRSPNVDDIGKIFDSEPGAIVIPNPDLKAEYAYNFDLGVAKVFSNTLKLELTGYYSLLDNAMVRRDYTLNGSTEILYDGETSKVQAIQNAASANVYGVQAGLEIKLPGGFCFVSDFNYQHGEEELDDGSTSPMRHAAPLFGVSRIRYHHEGLRLEFNIQYQGEKSHDDLSATEQGKDEIYALDKDGNTYSPSWYTLNLKAAYQLSGKLLFSGGIENITDQRYRPYSSGISAPGRNVVLALQYKF